MAGDTLRFLSLDEELLCASGGSGYVNEKDGCCARLTCDKAGSTSSSYFPTTDIAGDSCDKVGY